MKLLIITQKVDVDDPVLGFFHRWIEEFAKHSEKITVICLEKGKYNLPENVKVLSLGKEEKRSRLQYLINFYKYIWQERKNYSTIFVHMNQEYVLLGWKFWALWGKRVLLWRNHAKGSISTRLAVLLSNRVFYTSGESFTARFGKSVCMPVGIDTDFFKPDQAVSARPNSILFLGRIAPVKNVDVFISSLSCLLRDGINFSATIIGSSLPADHKYENGLKVMVEEEGLADSVQFLGPMTQTEILNEYRKHMVYVNLTASGSMDKTIFEAMACGLSVVALNQSLAIVLNEYWVNVGNVNEIAQKIKLALEHPVSYRDYVVKEHDLKKTIEKVLSFAK